MLTFLGSVAPKVDAMTSAHARLPKAFIWSLSLFALGVFCGALAAVYSYVANHGYAEANAIVGFDRLRSLARESARSGQDRGSRSSCPCL